MTVFAAASDRHCATATSGIDRAVRLATAIAVLAVAGIAAYVSYWHAYAVVRAHGESGITAGLEPATIDGLVYASSMVVLYAARHGCRYPAWLAGCSGWGSRPPSPRTWPRAGPTAPSGRWSRAWPAVSLAGSYELLVWLIRISGTAGPGPSPEHPCDGAVCRAVAGSAPAAAASSEQDSRSDRAVPGESGAVNDAAVAAYRLSVQAGNPLSERKLAQLFGRTSRRWARARITDARQASPLPDSPGTPVTA